jgi:hypothetical protein
MATHRPRRARIQQIAGLMAAGCLLGLASGPVPAGAAQPIAKASGAEPVARISRAALHSALSEQSAARRSVRRDATRLSACRRLRPGHCRSAHRALRHARARLTRDERRVRRLRAHFAQAHRRQTVSSAPGATAPATTFGEPFVKGVDTNLQGWGAEALPAIAGEMRSLGVNWAREDLSWSDVEPQRGVFDWSSFDKIVYAAQAHGITILPIVGYAPSWSSPTDASGYASFVKAAVERYGPGTQANLRWWELWNEPYFSYAWGNKTPEPQAYGRDALAAAEAAKGASPTVKLLVAADYQDSAQSGSSQWETSWVDDMFNAAPSLGRWIDGVSVHPYGDDPSLGLAKAGGWQDSNGGWSFQRIDTVRSKFLAHGVNVPFWITEAGWSTAQVSESTQAAYYSDLIPQVAARPWVRALFPYCLREFDASGSKESQFGLLKYGSWEPKPAFYALQRGLGGLS